MVDKVMTAEARIQARDMTGNVFKQVGDKLKRLGAAQRAVEDRRPPPPNIDRHVRTVDRINKAADAVGPVILAGIAAGVREFASATVHTYREFDKIRRYQKAILHLSDDEQKPLVDQAIHMGGSTRFNDIQVLEAQTDLAQRGISRDVIMPMVDAAASFAAAMGTDLPEAAKTLEGIIFSTGKHMDAGKEAISIANRTASFATKLAKIGGLDDNDVQEFFKFGGPPGSVAGFSDPTLGAMAALLRRSNTPGSESGVAVRSISGSLVAPTNKAIAAMGAMGIDYNKYNKMPGSLSADNLEGQFKRDFGKGFSKDVRAKVGKITQDPELVGNREEFVKAITEAVEPLFEHKKDGKLKAMDSHNIAKSVGQFHRNSTESVDVEGLLRDLISAKPTAGQSNAIFGKQQGARFQLIARAGIALFDEYVNKLISAGDEFHKQIADERNQGFDAAVTRFEGAVKNIETAIGRANDSWATSGMDKLGQMAQHFAEADPEVVRFATGLAAATTAIATFETGLVALGIMQKATIGEAVALGVGGGFLARMAMYSRAGIWGVMAYLAYQMLEQDGPGMVKKDAEQRNSESEIGLKAKLDALDQQISRLTAEKGNPGEISGLRAQEMDLLGRIAEIEQRKATAAEKPVDVNLKGAADINVKVSVDGPGRVTGLTAKSSGNVKARVGTTMPDAGK